MKISLGNGASRDCCKQKQSYAGHALDPQATRTTEIGRSWNPSMKASGLNFSL